MSLPQSGPSSWPEIFVLSSGECSCCGPLVSVVVVHVVTVQFGANYGRYHMFLHVPTNKCVDVIYVSLFVVSDCYLHDQTFLSPSK
jgi:hypothetical protein